MANGGSSHGALFLYWRLSYIHVYYTQYALKELNDHISGHEVIERVPEFLSSGGSRPTVRS